MEIIDFIEHNTVEYIRWLHNTLDKCFTFCCTYVSQTLGAYLQYHYPEDGVSVIVGTYTEIEDDWIHSWLQVGSNYVDVTVGYVDLECTEDYYDFVVDAEAPEYPYNLFVPREYGAIKEILTYTASISEDFNDYMIRVGDLVHSVSSIREIYF